MPPGNRWRSTLQLDHPLAGAIWSVAEGRRVDGRILSGELRAARYRLLGEGHDNPDHHEIQLILLRSLAEVGLKPAVAFEQFDREHDAALRQRLAGGNVTADDVASAVSFNHKGWDWSFYRPLVEVALRHGMPLRAANLSRAAAQPIIKGGLEVLGAGRIAALRIEAAWTPQRENALRHIIFDGHCRALPERLLPAMAAAQRVRDATLAAALLDAGPGGAVLIAGNGHVRRDLGVPLYLRAADTRASICAVGILEVEAEKTDPRSYVDTEASPPPAFDFVCFTPQWSRPDPCAGFKTSAIAGSSAGRPAR
jgi:uncharacterized iron-regulated protein